MSPDRPRLAPISPTGLRERHNCSVALDYPQPELTDGVVRLRPWRPADIDCVRRAALDPAITAVSSVPSPFTTDGGLDFIARQLERQASGDGLSLAIADAESDQADGLLWLGTTPEPDELRLGYWLTADARHRGHATRAVTLAADWAFATTPTHTIRAAVHPGNARSQQVLRAAHFRLRTGATEHIESTPRAFDALIFTRQAP